MQTLGIVDLVWRGQQLDIEKNAKLRVGGYKKNPVPTSRRGHYAEEYEMMECTATMPLKRGQRLSDTFTRSSGELIAKCDTGQIFVCDDAFVQNTAEFTGGEGGKVEIKWGGSAAQEMVNV